MLKETSDKIYKLSIIFRFIEVLYLFREEQVNDHCKRSLLRFFFIQIDNLLKIGPTTKNNLFQERIITQKHKMEIERRTKVLKKDYENAYDTIRDKIAAHAQPMDLISLLYWWKEIDFITVELLYEEAKNLQSCFSRVNGVQFSSAPERVPLVVPADTKLSVHATKPSISTDRFASVKENTVSMIPCHSSQEKAQRILSITEFLETDFELTSIVEQASTIYHACLFEVAWLLAIIDTCSLLDNLFEDSQYDESLLNQWKEISICGYRDLEDSQSRRNLEFESSVRHIRNSLAAHIDLRQPFRDVYMKYLELDLTAVYRYAYTFIERFRTSCLCDGRTKMFAIHNRPLNGVMSVPNWTMPFDK